jgi:hypothetical protein
MYLHRQRNASETEGMSLTLSSIFDPDLGLRTLRIKFSIILSLVLLVVYVALCLTLRKFPLFHPSQPNLQFSQ